MKKKLFSILLLLFLMPNVVMAGGDCSSSVISGDASSQGPTSTGPGGCGDSVCLSMYNNNYVGVRFQIYKYDGSGGSNGVKLIGAGVDVWATESLNSSYHHFSSPKNNNLRVKASCQMVDDDATVGWGKSLPSIYSLSASSYLSQTDFTVAYDSAIKSSYNNGKINKFVLTLNGNGNSTGGWLHTNFFAKLSDPSGVGKEQVKKLFRMTEAEMSDLLSKPEDYYVTAEMLYRFVTVTEGGGRYVYSYGGKGGHYYLGTVSEAGYLHGYGNVYNALLSSGGNVGKLVSSSVGGTYLIKQVKPTNTTFMNDVTAIGNNANAYAGCSSAYGLAVYHVSSVCEDCGDPDPIYQEPTYDQCEPAYLNTCKEYDGSIMSKTEQCDESTDTGNAEVTLKSKSCYHDEKNYTTILAPTNTTNAWDYQAKANGDLKYYRIHCTEALLLTNLPNKKNVFISEGGTGSLYLGYKLKYTKICDLEYRNKNNNGWGKYDNSLAKKHITDYEGYKTKINSSYTTENNKLPGLRNTYEDKKEKYEYWVEKYNKNKTDANKEAMDDAKEVMDAAKASYDAQKSRVDKLNSLKTSVDAAINEVNAVKSEAENRFSEYQRKDYKDENVDIASKAKVNIVSSDASSSSTKTLTLIPVHCMSINETSEKYCDLMTNTWYKKETADRIVCDNSSGESNSIVTVADSTKEIKTKYEKTIYYGLDPSYILTQTGKSKVYHDKAACDDAANAQGGVCEKIENAWVMDPIDQSISIEQFNDEIGSSALDLTVSGWGACSQFSYKLTCDYDYVSSRNCTKNCIGQYINAEGEITNQSAYNECFRRYCSCDSYCGSDVACRARYCPEECEGCGWDERGTCDGCENECDNKYPGSNIVNIQKNIECKTDNCCNSNCNGEAGCLYNCCVKDCNQKAAKNVLKNRAELNRCIYLCDCPNGNCINYVYRTINQARPFPNGTNAEMREPGANWQGKVEYITKGNVNNTIYYDRTSGMDNDYEYAFELSSDDIKAIKAMHNTTDRYTTFYKSKIIKNPTNNNVYCSSIIHEELEDIGVVVQTNRITNVVGSGCK